MYDYGREGMDNSGAKIHEQNVIKSSAYREEIERNSANRKIDHSASTYERGD